jgi:hypothetical protein
MQYRLSFADSHQSNKYFLIAFGLLNILAFTLLLCAISFLAGLTISKWQFPLACLLALIANYRAAGFLTGGKGRQFFLKSVASVLILVLGLVLFAGLFYDISFDGQWYHQETVYMLKQGSNPAYQKLSLPADEETGNDAVGWCTGIDRPVPNVAYTNKNPVIIKELNINNFSKGSEIIEAALYQLTNRIETAKAVNGMMLAASFFLCLSLFYKIDRIGARKKWLLAFLFSFNPVTLIQMNTFCVDGNLACTLLCLIAVTFLLFGEMNRYYLFLLGTIMVLGVNIKFTNIVFIGMYSAGFLIILLVCKKTDAFKKVLTTGILSSAIGILCCGYNPYITNLINHRNPFYGLAETRDVIRNMTPPLFKDLNRFEKLFFSLSAHQGSHSADKSALREIPKIPFTLNKDDIINAKYAQQQMSTFGPFFSGALLIAGCLFVFLLVYHRRTQPFRLFMAVWGIILLTVLIIPEPWWGRFVPQSWLIPLLILCMAEFISFRGERFFKGILYISLVLNIAWALMGMADNLFLSIRINYRMEQLKAINQPINIEYCPNKTFKSNQVRFDEWGIPTVIKPVTGPYVYNVTESDTRYDTPVPLPDLPKSFLVKLVIKITGKEE